MYRRRSKSMEPNPNWRDCKCHICKYEWHYGGAKKPKHYRQYIGCPRCKAVLPIPKINEALITKPQECNPQAPAPEPHTPTPAPHEPALPHITLEPQEDLPEPTEEEIEQTFEKNL